jgi:hypothetical protein
MARWSDLRLAAAAALALAPQPAAAQGCPPIDAILATVVLETVASRADVTDRLACHFPPGLTFNGTALTLEANGFDLLNKVERSFQTWRTLGGEEFVSRRVVATSRGPAEFRVTVHMQNRKIARFSAQYLAGPR